MEEFSSYRFNKKKDSTKVLQLLRNVIELAKQNKNIYTPCNLVLKPLLESNVR